MEKTESNARRLAVLEYPYLYAAWHVCREDHARAVSERRPFSGARRSVDLYREKGTYGKARLPYTVEEITGAPDPIRGQVVKASIVLTKGTEGTEALKKEIQTYVKTNTAPYKYPRIVEFRDELPKTISGKIRRVELKG